MKYDRDKDQNLGYSNKYAELNEFNKKLLVIDSNILVFKKNKKTGVKDRTQMECFIFNKELSIQKNYKIEYSVRPDFIFKCDKGFLIFDDSITNAYYYELY